jgi:hypothetical protein
MSKIQFEIMTNGPVEAQFIVYEDFLTYSSGVYQHVFGTEVGYHAVKLLGWGSLDSTDYWYSCLPALVLLLDLLLEGVHWRFVSLE